MFQKIINKIKAFFTSMENETIEKSSSMQEVPLKNDNPNTNAIDFIPPRESVLSKLEAARKENDARNLQALNDNKSSGNETSNGNTSGNSNFKRVLSNTVINTENDEKSDKAVQTNHEAEEQIKKEAEEQHNNVPLMNPQNHSYIDEIKKKQIREAEEARTETDKIANEEQLSSSYYPKSADDYYKPVHSLKRRSR